MFKSYMLIKQKIRAPKLYIIPTLFNVIIDIFTKPPVTFNLLEDLSLLFYANNYNNKTSYITKYLKSLFMQNLICYIAI